MSDLLSTREAAVFLGISVARIRQIITAGELRAHSVMRVRGNESKRFERSVLEAFRNERQNGRTGAIAVNASLCEKAFKLFARGATFPVCVRELAVGPHVVRRLYREWKTPLGHELAPTNEENGRAAEQDEQTSAAAFAALMDERRKKSADEHRARMEKWLSR